MLPGDWVASEGAEVVVGEEGRREAGRTAPLKDFSGMEVPFMRRRPLSGAEEGIELGDLADLALEVKSLMVFLGGLRLLGGNEDHVFREGDLRIHCTNHSRLAVVPLTAVEPDWVLFLNRNLKLDA